MKKPCPMAWAIKWRKQSNENPMPHGMGYKMEEAK